MIEAQGLTKRYGRKTAVDQASFTVREGAVTGFLGPNGAGKSTAMRLMVGLDNPTAGSVTIAGRPYAEHANPMLLVGALLDAKGVHPGRSARSHLRALAATHGIPDARVSEVLEMTGIAAVANKRVGGFSLGMGQRLGIAAAMLGDPEVLILDEPINGLDPDGVLWVRSLVRRLAAEGRTILLSSHLMSEMAQTADHIIVLGRGRVLADAPVSEFVSAGSRRTVRVASPDSARLATLLGAPHITITRGERPDTLMLDGIEAAQVGQVAASHGLVVHELSTASGSLEDAYLRLTRDDVEYRDGVESAA